MENKEKKESALLRFFRKRRISVRNASDESEEWYVHISPAGLTAAAAALLLILFIGISSLVVYTPLTEFLPGYKANAIRSRESLTANIMRLDSMERLMRDMMTYNQNIALIMDGKTPVVRTITNSDSTRIDKTLVMPSHEDSLLRASMQGDGPYSLHHTAVPRSERNHIEMSAPASGIVTSGFDISQNRFGVTVAAAAGAQISAIAPGTVILASWSPESGHTVVIQHDRNTLSIYKSLALVTVGNGQRVDAGSAIGYNGGDDDGEHSEQIVFELWDNGKPVDPESYIKF
ncbi:MAG: M23 family metallopeptidase [Alistipes sp.]|nr:M23 family metallopeptidase [Alistipes sp.]